VVLRGGWLFYGIAEARKRNTGIVIRDGKFSEVGADLEGCEFSEARIIDLDDNATILPGMFDLHAHYIVSAENQIGPSGPDDHEVWKLRVVPLAR
jgi:predicted amidohydrolase YtcJ